MKTNVMTRRRAVTWSAALMGAVAVCLLAAAPATANAAVLERAQTIHAAAYEHMQAFMGRYVKDGFAKRVDFGTLKRYRVRLAQARIVINTKLSGLAQYDPDTNTITLARDPRKIKVKGGAMGETIWHEVTHALEHTMGDRFTGDELHKERNVDYMTHVVRSALPWLDEMERKAKAGASVANLKAYWAKFLKEMAAAGKLPSTVAFPPDLALMRSWFGFRANPEDIRKLYLSGAVLPGKQGANLRKALALPPETWTGKWDADWAVGDWVLTQSGQTVTGYLANSLDPPDAFVISGSLSADGKTFTGSIDQKDPKGYDWSFVVTVSGDWTRFEGPVWVIGMEDQPFTLHGARK